jgi:DNA-binding NarL/FixJ family response regulator
VSGRTIRVAIADDHALVRAGLVALLAQEPDIRVVREAGDGPGAIAIAQEERPDVLLVDVALPGLSGLEVARRVLDQVESVAVVIVSMHKDDDYVLAAIRAGAAGYVVKEGAADELVAAVRAAAEGRLYLSPIVARAGGAATPAAARAALAQPSDLTPRERDVLVLISDGLSTKEIGSRLGISVKTADAHRQALMRRLGIHDVAGLTKFALKHGLTTLG